MSDPESQIDHTGIGARLKHDALTRPNMVINGSAGYTALFEQDKSVVTLRRSNRVLVALFIRGYLPGNPPKWGGQAPMRDGKIAGQGQRGHQNQSERQAIEGFELAW